jgi:hypothetical protein
MSRFQREGTEPLLGPAAATKLCFELTGHRPSRSTWWRWHLAQRLRARRIGGRLYTTESAIRAMLAADELRNRGSQCARGAAARDRIEQLAGASLRRKGGRR